MAIPKKPPRRAARTADTPPADLRDGFTMTDEEIERSLQTGDNAGALEDYFGPAQYEEVRQLAQQAAKRGNAALLEGRKRVQAVGSRDWADYVFYGDPDFRLKLRA